MHNAIIYLGPSLSHEEAGLILDATYLPPVKRGDLASAIRTRPAIIGIIDGVFFENAAVGHREILAALKEGIRVIGASSMGALRAAELRTFGMEGVGEVYRRFASGEITADDEVALICDPVEFSALSEALVNIRITLEHAGASGVISGSEADSILTCARSLYYPERTWEEIIKRTAASEVRKCELLTWIGSHSIDQKRSDAIEALRYISTIMVGEKNLNG